MAELLIAEGAAAMERIEQLVTGAGVLLRIKDEMKKIIQSEAVTYGRVDIALNITRPGELGEHYQLNIQTTHLSGVLTNPDKHYHFTLFRNRQGYIEGIQRQHG